MRLFLAAALLVMPAFASTQPASTAPTKIAEVKKQAVGSVAIIRGSAENYKAPSSERAPHSINIKDETGDIRVPIWDDVWQKIDFRDKLKNAGTQVTARVKLSEFHGQIEGRVVDAADIKEGEATLTPLGPITWVEDLQAGMKQAAATNKDIFVFYAAASAENSQFLETKVLQDPKVIRAVTDKYVPVRIDITKQPQLASQLGIFRGGVFALYHANGTPISSGPISTVHSADDLLKALGSR